MDHGGEGRCEIVFEFSCVQFFGISNRMEFRKGTRSFEKSRKPVLCFDLIFQLILIVIIYPRKVKRMLLNC